MLFIIISCKKNNHFENQDDSLKGKTNLESTTQPKKSDTFQTYCNERFQFCIDYPLGFTPQENPVNGDGRTFLSKDKKAKITAYGGFALVDVHPTLEEYFEMTTSDIEINYKVFKKDYFIISYLDKNGDIVYSKTILKKIPYMGIGEKETEVFQTHLISYPKNQTHLYDAYCKRIANSFK